MYLLLVIVASCVCTGMKLGSNTFQVEPMVDLVHSGCYVIKLLPWFRPWQFVHTVLTSHS